MTIKTTITYDTPAEFEYDNTQLAVIADARLKRQPVVEQYDEEFSSDVGFVYDNTKAEFTLGGGLGLLADYAVDGNSDASKALGSKTASVVGSSSVAGGLLSFDATPINYVDYIDTLNLPQGNEGCIRFRMKPNYTGNPPTKKNLVNLYKGLEDASSKVSIHHSTNGVITTVLFDDQGGYVTAFNTTPITYDGVSFYEFELNFNMTTGDYRLFMDGILVSSELGVATGTRGETGVFRIGGLYLSASAGDGLDADISEVAVFNTVQHTANYTPEAFEPVTIITQIDQLQGVVKAHNFNTVANMDNSSIGDKVGTLNNATIVNEELVLNGLDNRWIMSNTAISEMDLSNEFTVRQKVKIPSYNPTLTQWFFELYKTGGFQRGNRAELFYFEGDLVFRAYNTAGSAFLAVTYPVALTLDQFYTFECFFSKSSNLMGIIIDGVRVATLPIGSLSRTNNADNFHIGSYRSTDTTIFTCDSFHVYENPPNTNSYPLVELPVTRYVESEVDLPIQTHLLNLLAVGTFSSTFTGTPRYLIGGKYWSGSSWDVSNGSFAQATSYADMVVNSAFYDISAENTLELSIVFPNVDTPSSVDTTTIDYLSSGAYAAFSTIVHETLITMNKLARITDDTVLIGSDEVRYTVLVNGLELWFNTSLSEWIAVDGTLVTTNTLAEINANSQTLAIDLGAEVQVKAYLVSTDFDTTPVLSSIEVEYTWGTLGGCEVKTCTVWGCVLDNAGSPIAGAKITVDGEDFFYTNSEGVIGADKAALISRSAEGYSNSEGEWGIEVVETVTDATTVDFVIEYSQNGKKIKKKYTGLAIPDQVAIPLGNLVNP